MNLSKIASSTKKLLSDNSPVILTAIGVTGTITTAYLTAKAAFRHFEVCAEEDARRIGYAKCEGTEPEDVPTLTNKEIFKLVWKLYVPAVVTGAMTCTCIIGANYLGTKKAAALAAAYTFSEKALEEYKAKVVETIGPENAQIIQKEIEKERQEKEGKPPLAIFLTSDADVLFLDAYSGRYFMCNKETIRRAANDMNYQILKSDWATVTDFYDKVGLEPTSESDEYGWNGEHPLELGFSTHETPDGKPCLSYEFVVSPIRNPWQI